MGMKLKQVITVLSLGMISGFIFAQSSSSAAAVAVVAPASAPAISAIWGHLSGLWDFIKNAAVLSFIAYCLSKFPNSKFAVFLKQIVDVASANIQHK